MSKKSSFRGPYEKELCKGNQTLLKHEPRSLTKFIDHSDGY